MWMDHGATKRGEKFSGAHQTKCIPLLFKCFGRECCKNKSIISYAHLLQQKMLFVGPKWGFQHLYCITRWWWVGVWNPITENIGKFKYFHTHVSTPRSIAFLWTVRIPSSFCELLVNIPRLTATERGFVLSRLPGGFIARVELGQPIYWP